MRKGEKRVREVGFYEILIIFLLLNPTLDLLTSVMRIFWGVELSIGILVRGAFLVFTVLYMLIKRRYHPKLKVITWIYLGTVVACLTIFLANMYSLKGLEAAVSEVKGVIKSFYFPILVVCILNCVYHCREKINIKTLSINAFYYSAVLLISQITNTQFSSYGYDKVGHTGWFYAANETGALMAILFPVVVWTVMENKKIYDVAKVGIIAIYIYCMYQIGTKVPALAAVGVTVSMLICYIIKSIICKTKKIYIKKTFISLVLCVISIVGIYISPVGKNLSIHSEWFGNNSQDIIKTYDNNHGNTRYEDGEEKHTGETKKFEVTEKQIRVLSFIFSSRDTYVISKIEDMMNSPLKYQLFGMGYTVQEENGSYVNDIVEIDYFDVLFAYGIIGAILYWVFVLGILIYGLYLLIRYMGNNICNYVWYGILAILLSLSIGFFSGHVFISPAVSIYPVIIIVFALYSVKTTKGICFSN